MSYSDSSTFSIDVVSSVELLRTGSRHIHDDGRIPSLRAFDDIQSGMVCLSSRAE